MFVTAHSLVKKHIQKLKEDLNKYHYNFKFDTNKIDYDKNISLISEYIMKFIFVRYDLYILTGIKIPTHIESCELKQYDPNEHIKIIDFFDKFDKAQNYKLLYSKYNDNANLQFIRTQYTNQCYVDSLMYALFSIPLQGRLEMILKDLNGKLINTDRRTLTHHILSFMLGVNNYIPLSNAENSFYKFLDALYKFDPEFTSKSQNETENLFLDHIIGYKYLDTNMLAEYQEEASRTRHYAIKRIDAWTNSFELNNDPLYFMTSIIKYDSNHFTSYLRTSKGWVEYNDLYSKLIEMKDVTEYKYFQDKFNKQVGINILSQEQIKIKLYNTLISSHESLWNNISSKLINDDLWCLVTSNIRNRDIITKIALNDKDEGLHEKLKSHYKDDRKIIEISQKYIDHFSGLVHESDIIYKNILEKYKEIPENKRTDKQKDEIYKAESTLNGYKRELTKIELIKAYHIYTDFATVKSYFYPLVKILKLTIASLLECYEVETPDSKVKTLQCKQYHELEQYIQEICNEIDSKYVHELIREYQDMLKVKPYPARLAIYDKYVNFN
jgi:hypothetical protein